MKQDFTVRQATPDLARKDHSRPDNRRRPTSGGVSIFQAQLAVGHLQLLDELSGANEHYTPSLLEESMPEPGREVRLSGAVPAKNRTLPPCSSQASLEA